MDRVEEIKEEIAMLQERIVNIAKTLDNNRNFDDAMEIMECLAVNIRTIKKLNRELQECLLCC